MRDILEDVGAWAEAGVPFALATVVRTTESAPRQPGAAMAVSADGEVVGSVSGGCVEAALHEVSQEVLATGRPRLETYGVAEDDFAAALTCGGTMDVFVERVPGPGASPVELVELVGLVRERRAVAVATVVEVAADSTPADGALAGRATGGSVPAGGVVPGGGRLLVGPDWTSGTLGSPGLDHGVTGRARGLLEAGRSDVVRLGPHGQQLEGAVTVFVEAMAASPTMYVYGATDFAAALVRTAKLLGHHVVVCDARPVFATARRFPDADEVVVAWPHEHLAEAAARGELDERSVVCVLTHDPKFDVPLLEVALASPAGYVGAMGSRATHRDRLARLRERGVGQEALARLSSPLGLDLGARTPEETAVSIAAEVIASRWGGSGARLRDVEGAIHR